MVTGGLSSVSGSICQEVKAELKCMTQTGVGKNKQLDLSRGWDTERLLDEAGVFKIKKK